jgi:hypothetical protein
VKKRFAFSSLIALIAGAIVVVAPLTVNAQTTANETARCTLAKSRISERADRIQTFGSSRSVAYKNLQSRVEALVTHAETMGYDATAMKVAHEAAEADIATFTAKLEAYHEILATLSQAECGAGDGSFASTLSDARAALTEVRTASLAIRTTYREEVIPAVRAYATTLNERENTQREDEK